MILFKRLFLVFFFASCAELASAETEIHAVGIYEGYVDELSSFEGGFARIFVDRPEATVVLSLNSHKPVRWIIEATPKTKVENILLHGTEPAASEVFLNGVDFSPQVIEDLGYAFGNEGKVFRSAVKALTSIFEGNSLASFYGSYKAPSEPFLINAIREEPKLKTNYLDEFVRPNEIPEDLVEFLSKNTAKSEPAVRFTYDGFVVIENNAETTIPIAPGLPQISHPHGATRDKAGGRLFGVTLGGEGFIYQYDLAKQKWSVLSSMKNLNAMTALSDAYHDQLIMGLGQTGTGIALFDLNTSKLSKVPLGSEDLSGFSDLYDPENEAIANLIPVGVSRNIHLARAEADKRMYPNAKASRTYLIDMLTGEATLVAFENEE